MRFLRNIIYGITSETRDTIADEGTLFTNATVAPSFAHVDAAAAVLPGQFDGQFVATLAVSTDRSETVAPSGIWNAII